MNNEEPFVDEMTRDAVGRALGLENFSDIKKNQDRIKRLIEWATAKGAKDNADIIWSIKELAGRVGSPKLGENLATHLGQYAYLDLERMRLEKQIDDFTPDGVRESSKEQNPQKVS